MRLLVDRRLVLDNQSRSRLGRGRKGENQNTEQSEDDEAAIW